MDKNIELFVPGRLCLMGEHSDWASGYRNINKNIELGYAIVTGIEEGIYATATSSDKFIVKFKDNKHSDFICDMNKEKLKKIAEEGGFFSYVAGVAYCVKEQYDVGGVEITITKETIPTKKGLSSSAAICVLVARAFNQIYNLHLNTLGEMNLAYYGEITTPSKCGRLDQACAFGKKPILIEFDGNKINIKDIKVGSDFYFVFADLMAKKDTVKILNDLNDCFPYPETKLEKNVQEGLGEQNKKIIKEALKYIENGDPEGLGVSLTRAQEIFDEYVAPACPEELTSPILHKTLNDKKIKSLTLGGKGVGSQGDGTIQFLAKDEKTQQKVKEYLIKKLKMHAYTLTIQKTKTVTKAIIPVAGNGTRMFPITKIMKKAFLPVIDKNEMVKPALMCILEELDEAGIEEIALVIDKDDQKDYEKFFNSNLSDEIAKKLTPEQLEYENKIVRIGRKIKYVIQEEKLGLGHAVSLCSNFANNDPVLLVLGDQLFSSYENKSCTAQLLDNFSETNALTISVAETPLSDVSKYGILSGVKEDDKDYYKVDKMYEKPDPEYAEKYLYTLDNGVKKYYSVFGEYVLTPDVFKKLEERIAKKLTTKGEYQITDALDEVREDKGMTAFITNGEMYDIGNMTSYQKTLCKKL